MSQHRLEPAADDARAATARFGLWLQTMPATVAIVGLILAIAVGSAALWQPAHDQPWWDTVAYGVPALREGKWWTPITGTFLAVTPAIYIPALLGFIGMGMLERRRGTRVALLWFGGGQLLGVVGTCAFAAVASQIDWPWAVELAAMRDVGPSGGTMACIAVTASLLRHPWRQRVGLATLVYVVIGLLFIGTFADVVHALAVGAAALAALPAWRGRPSSIRERRILAFATTLALGVVQIIFLIAPTYGPFGRTRPFAASWIDVLIDTLLVILVAHGLLQGRRWAWVVTVIVALANIVTALVFLVLRIVGEEDPWSFATGNATVAITGSVLWLLLLVFLVAWRRAFGTRRSRRRLSARDGASPTTADARRAITTHGGGSLSWMATWGGMDYFGTSTGIVAYQRHLGVAIALADPLGPPEGRTDSVREFIEAAEREALVPCFFSARADTKAAVPSGWRSLVVAEDTLIDLEGLRFTGKAWSDVRTALNRAQRENVAVRLSTVSAEPWGIRTQLRAISEEWVGEKGMPEMRFTLGTLHEAEDPEVRLAYAITPAGDVEGFLTWLPWYGPGGRHDGWTLDLMRRRDHAFPPVMELLIGASARAFADEGASVMSLSGAPLAHEPTPAEGQLAQVLARLSEALEPAYGFASLHHFKQKFRPRYEPLHLLYRDEADLAKIAPALVRAFLPEASLRDFLRAGREMVGRE